MELWGVFGGMVRMEYTAADLASGLSAINAKGIVLHRAEPVDDLTIRFSVQRRAVNALRQLVHERGEQLRSVQRRGLYYFANRMFHRPVLLVGMLIILALTIYLPGRVLFVEVEGNGLIPSKKILEVAAEHGVSFGASRRVLRSERIKNELMQEIPELQWVGVNTMGCRAIISVRERSNLSDSNLEKGVSSVVAERDGVIVTMTVTKGNPVCKVGQSVKKGQVLISGYTDLGLVIRAEEAQGEIFAETSRSFSAAIPEIWLKRTTHTCSEKKYSLIIGKKRINFQKGSGILDTTCGKMYEEYYITLPGGFQLPIALAVERWECYACQEISLEEEIASQRLLGFTRTQLLSDMIAGRIDSCFESVCQINGQYLLTGKYACCEMIGRTRPEEILENYENNRKNR